VDDSFISVFSAIQLHIADKVSHLFALTERCRDVSSQEEAPDVLGEPPEMDRWPPHVLR
jgi:hypothetical protein